MATKKRKPRKQTSDRVSRIASKVMRRWAISQSNDGPYAFRKSELCGLTWGEALALAGSCMVQDESRGPRGKR